MYSKIEKHFMKMIWIAIDKHDTDFNDNENKEVYIAFCINNPVNNTLVDYFKMYTDIYTDIINGTFKLWSQYPKICARYNLYIAQFPQCN